MSCCNSTVQLYRARQSEPTSVHTAHIHCALLGCWAYKKGLRHLLGGRKISCILSKSLFWHTSCVSHLTSLRGPRRCTSTARHHSHTESCMPPPWPVHCLALWSWGRQLVQLCHIHILGLSGPGCSSSRLCKQPMLIRFITCMSSEQVREQQTVM